MSLQSLEKQLFAAALGYPEATEDHPWGHNVVKVKGKIFLFVDIQDSHLTVTAKLPSSSGLALQLPFCKPTGYGLGRSGWVTAQFARPEQVPLEMLLEWTEESYRAVAPKKLAALRASAQANPSPATSRVSKGPAKPKQKSPRVKARPVTTGPKRKADRSLGRKR